MIVRNIFEPVRETLAENGKSGYTLVLPDSPNEYERRAAEEFLRLTAYCTGAELPVLSENAAPTEKRIYLGKCGALTMFGVSPQEISYKTLGSDGFRILSVGDDLAIFGVDRGTLFGVYGFFERAVGYRYYAADEWFAEKVDRFPFYRADIFEKPDIDARSFGYHDCYHIGFKHIAENAERLRVARNNYSDWIMAGHTYFELIPKSKYQAAHPDWYSPDGENLCLSADGLAEEFEKNVIERIRASKGGRYLMIGQQDNFGFCDCPKCRAETEKYGGKTSAVMMKFSNRIARGVGKWLRANAPEREIRLVTFAYNKTSEPPVVRDEKSGQFLPVSPEVVAEENLSVMYIPFGTVHNYPYTHEKNKPRALAFGGWSACAKSIFVWDYCANFDNFLVEFNDYHVIGDNYRFFAECGVEFLFDQGPYNTLTPCFDELKLFLHANLAWDTTLSTQSLMTEFFKAYYKDIAPQMRRYLDKMLERWNYISAMYGEDTRSGGMDSSFYLLPHFFPKEFLDDCMDIFTEARGVLESIRIEDWDRYVLLKQRMNRIMISVRFLLIKIYGRYYGDILPDKINRLKADMTAMNILKTNEGNFMDIG